MNLNSSYALSAQRASKALHRQWRGLLGLGSFYALLIAWVRFA